MNLITFLPALPRARSLRAKLIARWFDLIWPRRRRCVPETDWSLLLPTAGQIVSIVGPSGSGKSSVLRQLHACVPSELWLDLDSIDPPDPKNKTTEVAPPHRPIYDQP